MANFTIHGETSATKEDSGLNEVSLIESFDGNCLGFFLHFYIDVLLMKPLQDEQYILCVEKNK